MQRISGHFKKKLSRRGALIAGAFVLAFWTCAQVAQAQFPSGMSPRTMISGSVMIEEEGQPAPSVRVDIRSLTGGEVATAYTDSGGRFEVNGPQGGSYLVSVSERGYEPVEQRVDHSDMAAGLVLTLKKTKTFLPSHAGTVSVRELSIPSKARREFEKGIDRLAKNDAAGSLAHFKEATNAFPDYYDAFYQSGLANMELRRGPEAEQALQRAIDLSGGGYADPQFALGAVLCERGAWADAERVLRRGLDVDSNSWKGHLFLGHALFGQNRFEEAQKSAHEALLRKSDATSAYILLANVHIRKHEYILAIGDLDTFLKLRPTGSTSDQAREVRSAAQRVVSRFQQLMIPPQLTY
jgi:tetratricopeptide (TPR) repeat protein